MDYKELYEGVLERAKKEYNMHKDNHAIGIIDAIERIFPNIKKSKEDEIREFLYNLISSLAWRKDWPDNKKDCLAWLEKHCEQKSMEEHDFLKLASNSYALSFINYLDAHLYKGKMCISNGECEDIENAFRNADWGKIDRYYNKFTQEPIEWSEEDKRMLKVVIKAFETLAQGKMVIGGENASSIVSWLKSLRHQKHWKPSEEQMEALKGVQEGVFRLGILESLYKQLKAL